MLLLSRKCYATVADLKPHAIRIVEKIEERRFAFAARLTSRILALAWFISLERRLVDFSEFCGVGVLRFVQHLYICLIFFRVFAEFSVFTSVLKMSFADIC